MSQLLSAFALSLIVLIPIAIPVVVSVVPAIVNWFKNIPSVKGAVRLRRRELRPLFEASVA